MTLSERIFSKLVDASIAHRRVTIIVSAILTLLSVAVIALKADIRTDLKDIMPMDAKSVIDTFKIADRVGSVIELKVILDAKDVRLLPEKRQGASYQSCKRTFSREGRELMGDPVPEGMESWCDHALVFFAWEFTNAIYDPSTIANIAFHKDKGFFEKHILLYTEEEDLERLYTALDERLTMARTLTGEYKTCVLVNSEEECERPNMSLVESKLKERKAEEEAQLSETERLKREKEKTESGLFGANLSDPETLKDALTDRYKASELGRMPEFGIFPLPDGGTMLTFNVRFRDASTSLKAIKEHVKRIEKIAKDLNPKSYSPDLIVQYGGGLVDQENEYSAVVIDIKRSITFTVLSIFGIIAFFFMSFRVTTVILIPLIMGSLWTLAITFLTVGYLNVVTALIFAILLGLGIDYGIHLMSRFYQELEEGKTLDAAIRISICETGSAIFFGALTTAATFFTLLLSSFRGFSQFGLVAGIGVLLAFIAIVTILPAMVVGMGNRKAFKVPGIWVELRRRSQKASISRSVKLTVSLAIPALIGASVMISFIPNIQFEENFYNLRFRESKHDDTIDKYKIHSTRHGSPAVVLLDNLDEVSALQAIVTDRLSGNSVSNVDKFCVIYPNMARILVHDMGTPLALLGSANSLLPIYSNLQTILPFPDRNHTLSYTDYHFRGSRLMTLAKEFYETYPNVSKTLFIDTLPEVLQQDRQYKLLLILARFYRDLPEDFRRALPSGYPSDELTSVADFASIFSFMPGSDLDQERRLALIAEISDRISDRKIRFLLPEDREKIVELRKYLVSEPVRIDDLPEWVKTQFKEGGLHPLPPRPESGVDYTFGNIALIYQSTSTYDGAQAHRFTKEVRSLRVNDKVLTTATGAFVYSDMLKLITSSGLRIALLAFSLVFIVIIIQQRSIVATLIISLTLFSGVLSALGVLVLLDLKLGLFNIVILPIVAGIGVDGSIYLYERYRFLGRGSITVALKDVGGAIFMSSATTMIGFGGMIMSRHMGLNSMGQLSIIGISACFLTTILIEPALILLAEKLNIRSVVPKHDYSSDDHSITIDTEKTHD